MTTMKKKNINKHIPLRTCIACRQTGNKRQLIRLVRNINGSIQVDTSGKKPGRGAYLCNITSCWQSAVKGNRLENALRTNLTPENREQLAEYGNISAVDC